MVTLCRQDGSERQAFDLKSELPKAIIFLVKDGICRNRQAVKLTMIGTYGGIYDGVL